MALKSLHIRFPSQHVYFHGVSLAVFTVELVAKGPRGRNLIPKNSICSFLRSRGVVSETFSVDLDFGCPMWLWLAMSGFKI